MGGGSRLKTTLNKILKTSAQRGESLFRKCGNKVVRFVVSVPLMLVRVVTPKIQNNAKFYGTLQILEPPRTHDTLSNKEHPFYVS